MFSSWPCTCSSGSPWSSRVQASRISQENGSFKKVTILLPLYTTVVWYCFISISKWGANTHEFVDFGQEIALASLCGLFVGPCTTYPHFGTKASSAQRLWKENAWQWTHGSLVNDIHFCLSQSSTASWIIIISNGPLFEEVEPVILILCFPQDQVNPICSDHMFAFQGFHFAMSLVTSKAKIPSLQAFNQEFKGSITKTRLHLLRVQLTNTLHRHKHLHSFITILPCVGIQCLVLGDVSSKRRLLWIELGLVFHHRNVDRLWLRLRHSHLWFGDKGSPVVVVSIVIGKFSSLLPTCFQCTRVCSLW